LNPTSYVIDTEGNKMGSNWYGMIEGWTPDGRVIYTYEGTDGDRSIYTIDSDGTNKTLLYDNYRNNIIQFSSDGKNIIYTRKDSNTAPINETNIYLSDSDGTNEKLIVSHARLPILSPFDSFIVYENLDNKLTYVKHLATDVTYFFGETGYLYRKSAWQPV
jgi:Tol biopolymer transport system component